MLSTHKQALPGFILSIMLLLMVSCSKSGNEPGGDGGDDQHDLYEATVYPIGTVQGSATQKRIDAAGGTFSSADGKLRLTIPAGAVSVPTDFSIQPVSNTVPLGTGPAFRILPADLVTTKPVTVDFTYDAAVAEGQDEEALDLVTQDKNGTWKAMNKTVLNKTNKTLTAQTKHLGDFSFTGYYYLVPQKTVLSPNESTVVTVQTVITANDNTDEEETPMGQVLPFSQQSGVDNWEVTGPGTVSAPENVTAIYTAPSTINENTSSEIKLTLKNIRRPARLPNKRLSLKRKVTIAKENFMAGFYDGQPFDCVGVSVSDAGGITTIHGVTGQGKSVLIFANGVDVGSYPFGNPTHGGKSEIRCNISGVVYETVYTECGPPSVTKYASGAMTIKSYSNGSTVAGEFTATLYDDSDCTIKTKQITGSFRAKM